MDFNRLEIKLRSHQIPHSDPFHPGEYDHEISFWIIGRQFSAAFVSKRQDPNHSECLGGYARCLLSLSNMVADASTKLK